MKVNNIGVVRLTSEEEVSTYGGIAPVIIFLGIMAIRIAFTPSTAQAPTLDNGGDGWPGDE